jgi:hypothetical protein
MEIRQSYSLDYEMWGYYNGDYFLGCHTLPPYGLLCVGYSFDTKDGGKMFLHNVSKLLPVTQHNTPEDSHS